MELYTTILSTVAIIVSMIALIKEGKRNDVNLAASYFVEIYKNILIFDIPQARKRIKIVNRGKLSGINKMVEVMEDIRIKSQYFKYNDESFFKEIKESTQRIENFLVEHSEKDNSTEEAEFYTDLNKMIEYLYKIIDKKYKGKR